MEIVDMKNMVVLKNLPSNIVEEAFVVLKPNQKIKEKDQFQKPVRGDVSKGKGTRDYMIKEAELLVANYITNIENHKKNKSREKLEEKYKRLKRVTACVSILFFISVVLNFI